MFWEAFLIKQLFHMHDYNQLVTTRLVDHLPFHILRALMQ